MGTASVQSPCPSRDRSGFVLAMHRSGSPPSQSPGIGYTEVKNLWLSFSYKKEADGRGLPCRAGDVKDTGGSCLGCGCTLQVDALGRGMGAGLRWEVMGSH